MRNLELQPIIRSCLFIQAAIYSQSNLSVPACVSHLLYLPNKCIYCQRFNKATTTKYLNQKYTRWLLMFAVWEGRGQLRRLPCVKRCPGPAESHLIPQPFADVCPAAGHLPPAARAEPAASLLRQLSIFFSRAVFPCAGAS